MIAEPKVGKDQKNNNTRACVFPEENAVLSPCHPLTFRIQTPLPSASQPVPLTICRTPHIYALLHLASPHVSCRCLLWATYLPLGRNSVLQKAAGFRHSALPVLSRYYQSTTAQSRIRCSLENTPTPSSAVAVSPCCRGKGSVRGGVLGTPGAPHPDPHRWYRPSYAKPRIFHASFPGYYPSFGDPYIWPSPFYLLFPARHFAFPFWSYSAYEAKIEAGCLVSLPVSLTTNHSSLQSSLSLSLWSRETCHRRLVKAMDGSEWTVI
ncbi:hypothetical protein F5Y17DRAFT_37872 [Xylariaceae sp. FL0594]|nr:hypothetical protein F5Y17DRAFT_37872 [Xylariaceae sp. FL0594]